MLSAPVKSAKRISSLFSLGSSKDQNAPPVPSSPGLNGASESTTGRRRRSSSRPTRHVSTPAAVYTEPRTIPNPNPSDYDLKSLPPPPSLLALNQELATSPSGSPTDSRPHSRGRDSTRPPSSAGLAVPRSNPESRPDTPSKRKSWMPGMMGRSRASSVDKRIPTPSLPSAWIAGLDQKVLYDLEPLARGGQVREWKRLDAVPPPPLCPRLCFVGHERHFTNTWCGNCRSPSSGTRTATHSFTSFLKIPDELLRSRSTRPSLPNRPL